MTQELTPNTQITQENVEAKATELHAAADFVGKSTWHGGGTNRGHWRNQAKIALGIKPDTRRPALSPPAEGEVSREQWLWAAKIVRELGPSMSPGAMAATMERLAEKAPTPAPVDWNVVGPKLVEALREIVDQCPATCETSDAHTMADIAREALANQRSSVDLNAVAKDAAERAGKNASVAPQLLFAHILWALQDAFPALAAAQPGAGE